MVRARILQGFPLGIEISILLHVAVGLALLGIWHIHGRGMALPPVSADFDHAIAISLSPQPKPQPKPKVMPQTPQIPKPQPATVDTSATQAVEQTPPPAEKPSTPEIPQQQEQPQDQASPDYISVVEGMLNEYKRYPRQAVLDGTEGEVTVYFVINSQGTVLLFQIDKSSGSDVLDHEVVRLIHSVRFPPFPKGDKTERKEFTEVIEFKLGG